MKKIIFILFAQFVVAQQIPLDSISYEYFYEKELQQIVSLKQLQKDKPFSSKAQFEIAEIYQRINCEDSAYSRYYKIYEQEKASRTLNEDEFKELLLQVHKTETNKHNYFKETNRFLNELQELSNQDKNDKWSSIVNKELATVNFIDSMKYNLGYSKMLRLQKSSYYKENQNFKTGVLLNLGSFNIQLNNYKEASRFLNESYFIAKQNNDYLNQSYAKINLGVNEIYKNNYFLAINHLDEASKIPNQKYLIKINRIVHSLKKRAYDSLADFKNSEIQKLYLAKYDSLVDDFRKNSNFYEIDVVHQTKEKDKKIEELSSFKRTFNNNKIVYSVLLFLVFLLALYSFVRWKKTDRIKSQLDKENQSLNIENQKTKTELETVKALVINDHIVLKNKSKVYLEALICVKSDGHYLNLFTTSGKEFVRGKISEIEKQLPPNFVKCHRSNIINKNYIKQYNSLEVVMTNGQHIPLSRGFKF